MNFCFCNFQCCVNFYHFPTNGTSQNSCQLNEDDRAQYKRCFRCRFVEDKYYIGFNRTCAEALQLLCVELYLKDTSALMNFSLQALSTMNDLFSREAAKRQDHFPMLFVHVDNDSLDELNYENYRKFDQLSTRIFKGLSLELENRFDRPTLKLNPNNKNMTLDVLHINIYCNEKGLYQYGFWIEQKIEIRKELICEIRPPNLFNNSTNIFSPQTNLTIENRFINIIKSNIIVISVCFSLSLLLPCVFIVYCLYLMYQRRNQTLKSNETESESVQSDETDQSSLMEDENLVISSPPVVQTTSK